jgi:uncharacterized protein (UPF0332 family)
MDLPEGLLDVAQHLSRRELRSSDNQAGLRRAVSTAYYALFHLLISDGIENWKRVDDRHELARMFEHNNMKTACANKRDALKAESKKAANMGQEGNNSAVNKHLQIVAETFVEMHQQRESADYDYATTWTSTDVLATIASVEAAFTAWRAVRTEDAARAFLFTLLQKKRR